MEVRRHQLLLTINRNKLVILTALWSFRCPGQIGKEKNLLTPVPQTEIWHSNPKPLTSQVDCFDKKISKLTGVEIKVLYELYAPLFDKSTTCCGNIEHGGHIQIFARVIEYLRVISMNHDL